MGALSRPNWGCYFPSLTFRSFLSHYLPASGALSHTLFAVHIFNPSFVSRVFTIRDLAVSNTILFTANLGLGFYVYYRYHLHRLKKWDRVELSVFSTTMFNFGSLLAAVLIKSLLPHNFRSPLVHLENNGKLLNNNDGLTLLSNGRRVCNDGDESSGYGTQQNGSTLPH
ncbi:hypothetical protein DICVIV_08818 [Dictyocaulus viviparus]|uniref:Uncharacterized protein n=1 Tax=Dictyocaulus viviparus TaxID=29172 RepID=A0A0D8XN23_DICVI|nr:hypothetical protein DICVIV_08818 [Dictyocaulus viviparus]